MGSKPTASTKGCIDVQHNPVGVWLPTITLIIALYVFGVKDQRKGATGFDSVRKEGMRRILINNSKSYSHDSSTCKTGSLVGLGESLISPFFNNTNMMDEISEYLKVINDNMEAFGLVLFIVSFMGVGIYFGLEWVLKKLFKRK